MDMQTNKPLFQFLYVLWGMFLLPLTGISCLNILKTVEPGEKIVYAVVGKNRGIYAMDPNGKNNKQLRNGYYYLPRMGPNGKILYLSMKPSEFAKHGLAFHAMVNSMDRDGGAPEVVLDKPIAMGQWHLSPKGRKIVFYSAFEGPGNKNQEGIVSSAIYVGDLKNGSVKRITDPLKSAGSPSWSPDGNYIAFTSNQDGDNEIYVYQIKTKQIVQITVNETIDYSPLWSPSGNKIVYISGKNTHDPLNVFVYDFKTKTTRQLTKGASFKWICGWSPDGKQILITYDGDLRLINIDAAAQRRISVKKMRVSTARFSPDGKRILIGAVERRKELQMVKSLIYVYNLEAKTLTLISDPVLNARAPAWLGEIPKNN